MEAKFRFGARDQHASVSQILCPLALTAASDVGMTQARLSCSTVRQPGSLQFYTCVCSREPSSYSLLMGAAYQALHTLAVAVSQVGKIQPDRAAKDVPLQVILAVRLIWEHGTLHALPTHICSAAEGRAACRCSLPCHARQVCLQTSDSGGSRQTCSPEHKQHGSSRRTHHNNLLRSISRGATATLPKYSLAMYALAWTQLSKQRHQMARLPGHRFSTA